jgi:hypothetical protein
LGSMRTGTEAAPPNMPRAPIRPLAPTATAEKRPTLPDRAPRTTTNIATPHTMLKGQGLRSAVTPMAAPRRIQPARETSATSAYGGSAYHAEGSGTTTATGAYGGTATHYQGVGTVGTTSSVRLHTPVTITTVGQLRFTIRRSLLTPTLRAATTAEAGPPPGQQLLAPLLALRLERQSRRPIIAQPTPMPTRPAWRRERQRRRANTPLLLPTPTTLAWRPARRIRWEKSSRRHQPVAQRPP